MQFHPAHQTLSLLLSRGEPNWGAGPFSVNYHLGCPSTAPHILSTFPLPQVQVYDLAQYEHCPDDVLVLGTDGLWDVTSDREVAATVDKVLSAYEPNDPCR